MADISTLSNDELMAGYKQMQSASPAPVEGKAPSQPADISQLSDADLQAQYEKAKAKDYYNDPSSSLLSNKYTNKFEKQMTKGIYDSAPFGKRAIKTFDPNQESDIKNTPEPQTWDEKLGRFVGGGLSFLPGFEAGAGLGKVLVKPVAEGAQALTEAASATGDSAVISGASKVAQGAQGLEKTAQLAGGSVASGAQETGQALSEGDNLKDAAKKGAATAATTMVGGKVIEGASKAIGDTFKNLPQGARDVAGRIHDMIVRLPTKAFQYGKDPLDVMQKEGIVANSTTDYAEQAKMRLDMRSKELNEAIADNKSKLDLSHSINHRIDSAISEASSSLSDRSELTTKLDDMRQRILSQYPDLNKISVQDAVKLKRKIADDFPFSPMESPSSTSNLMAKAGHQIYHDINSAVEAVAPKITELNHRVSGLIDISKAATNRMAVESRNNPIGLIGTIIGTGVGSHMGGVVGGAEGALAGMSAAVLAKLSTSPAVLTRVAKALATMGEADKINLYKAAPWFMDLAQKAHDFVGKIAPNSTASIGIKQGEKEVIPKIPNMTGALDNSDVGSVGELFGQPGVVKRPAQFVKTSQSAWPEVEEKPSAAAQDAVDAMTTYDKQPVNRVKGLAAGAGTLAGASALSAEAQAGQSKEDNSRMKLGPQSYTKQEEGFKGSIYNDTTGHKTVGYGFNVDDKATHKLIPQDVLDGHRDLTKGEADTIFNKLYTKAQNDAVKFVGNRTWNNMNDKQRQAVTDMSYNLGAHKLEGFSKLKAHLQGGNWDKAAHEVLNSAYAKEVPNRARRNAALVNGSYDRKNG